MKNNRFARFAAAALSLAMLSGCGASQSSDSAAEDAGSADPVELTVFAAASMTETLNRIAEDSHYNHIVILLRQIQLLQILENV